MPKIKWDEDTPADDDKIGLGAQEVRSIKSSIAVGFGEWHNFPGSGGGTLDNPGRLKPGASKFLYDVASNSSSSAAGLPRNRDRYYLTSDKGRLEVYTGPTTTAAWQVGGVNSIEHSHVSFTNATSGDHRQTWVTGSTETKVQTAALFGTTVNAAAGTLNINYEAPHSGGLKGLTQFADLTDVFVQITPHNPDWRVTVQTIADTALTSYWSYTSTAAIAGGSVTTLGIIFSGITTRVL